MNKTKFAILFHGKSGIPLSFTEFKKYEVGTGYFALYDCDEGFCLLCRCLDESEISYYGDNISKLVIKSGEENELKTNMITEGITVIIITTRLKNIAEADDVISTYKKALDEI